MRSQSLSPKIQRQRQSGLVAVVYGDFMGQGGIKENYLTGFGLDYFLTRRMQNEIAEWRGTLR